MARVKAIKRGKSPKADPSGGPQFAMDAFVGTSPASVESVTANVTRLMQKKNFSSIAEANAFLKTIVESGDTPQAEPCSPLEEAQDIMYKAWDSPRKQAVNLAKKALELSKDCADAYVLLAQETACNVEGARELYEKGVEAGERTLGGPVAFKEFAGHFWNALETRPYMRARFGLAKCLWELGERQKAIEHYTDILRLNPDDNQGARYILINCLLETGDTGAAEKLLKKYKWDCFASWAYSRALLSFQTGGDSMDARNHLRKALKQNRFVAPYLVGTKPLPITLPPFMSPGCEDEAIHYVVESWNAWERTDGAVDWLKANVNES